MYVKGKAVILGNAFLGARHSLECEDLLLLIAKCNCLLLQVNLEVTHVQLGAIALLILLDDQRLQVIQRTGLYLILVLPFGSEYFAFIIACLL